MNVWKECIAASFTPYKLIADLKCLCWHSKRNLQWKVMWKFSCSNYAWLIFIKCLFVDIHRIPWSKWLHVTRKLQKLNEGKNNNRYWNIAIISYRCSMIVDIEIFWLRKISICTFSQLSISHGWFCILFL